MKALIPTAARGAQLIWALLLAIVLAPGAAGKVRVYYLAADEIIWNFAPKGDRLRGTSGDADIWLKRGARERAPIFHKAVYREYTDATFQTRKTRTPDQIHLGMLGPIIRAEVGDSIEVTLKNNTRFPVSLHPHGVFYTSANEGARSPGKPESGGDSVAPGRSYVYHWEVPERAGPGPNDPSSIAWLYHSHVDSMRDTAAGLVGVLVIARRGSARADATPNDVDREFVTYFGITEEGLSPLARFNTEVMEVEGPGAGKAMAMPMLPTLDANRFFAINGFIYGNLPGLKMKVGERVRWYLVALGGESDLHTPHWHGNVVTVAGRRTDVVELLPASMRVADMIPDNPGTWLFHCHVEDHMMAGMTALYEVTP